MIKKTKKLTLVLSLFIVLVVGLQNCSDFQMQEEIYYEYGLNESMKSLDSNVLPVLLKSDELVTWSKQEDPEFVNKAIFADQISMVVVADRTATGNLLTVRTAPGVQEATIRVVDGQIQAVRSNSVGVAFTETLDAPVPPLGEKMVIAAGFSSRASKFSLMVNGTVQKGVVKKEGSPFEFAYVTKQVSSEPQNGRVTEFVVFGGDSLKNKGKLTMAELNSMSRYLAQSQDLDQVIFDPVLVAEGAEGEFEEPSEEFKAAKAVIEAKCVTCHRKNVDGPKLSNLTESRAIGNGWVVRGNPEASILYYRLNGSRGPGPKDMPKEGSLSAEEVQTIENWILNIQ